MLRRLSVLLCAVGLAGYLAWSAAARRHSNTNLPSVPAIAAKAGAESPLARRLAWYKKVTVDAYAALGPHDAAWDEPARQCVDAFCRSLGPAGTTRNGDEEDDIWLFGRKALDAGCRDPLVTYAVARNLTLRNAPTGAIAHAHFDAADRFNGSNYSAYWKALASLHAARYVAQVAAETNNEKEAKRAGGYADAALAAMPEAFADAGLPAYELYDFFTAVVDIKPAVGGDPGAYGDKVVAILEKSPLPRSVALTGKGDFYLRYGWDARGTGMGNTVTRRGGQLFAERIATASNAFAEAWKLDPSNAEAANGMLVVEKAFPSGPGGLEQWYQCATRADPDSYRAAGRKMESLYPIWRGSAGEMIQFGRELLASRRWEAGLPLRLVDAHWWLSLSSSPGGNKINPAYFADDSAVIWEDIQAAYKPYLERVPNSRYHRTRYALLAAWCGQWAEADRQFKKLGDDYSRRATSEAIFCEARDEAAAKAGKAP